MLKKIFLMIYIVLSLHGFTQEISQKQDISLFDLHYYGHTIPDRVVGSIDAAIRGTFVNLGRFNVLGLDIRMSAADITDFAEQTRALKETQIEIPEEVQIGHAMLTEAQYNQLIGSFLVIVPYITDYFVEDRANNTHEATIKTSYTILDGGNLEAVAVINLESNFLADTVNEAVSSAVDSISYNLDYELRKLDIFQIRTGVIHREGRTVHLELGREMGLKKGEEYALIESRILVTGREYKKETGLVVLKDVQQGYSLGDIVYGDPQLGDQLQEIPRFGMNIEGYGSMITLYKKNSKESTKTAILGLRGVATRGFYRFRPLIGFELPFYSPVMGLFIPAYTYLGSEANWTIGRLSLNPYAALGAGFIFPIIDLEPILGDAANDQYLTHLGLKGGLKMSFLLGRDWRIYGEAALSGWLGVWGETIEATGGIDILGLDFLNSHAITHYTIGIAYKQ